MNIYFFILIIFSGICLSGGYESLSLRKAKAIETFYAYCHNFIINDDANKITREDKKNVPVYKRNCKRMISNMTNFPDYDPNTSLYVTGENIVQDQYSYAKELTEKYSGLTTQTNNNPKITPFIFPTWR